MLRERRVCPSASDPVWCRGEAVLKTKVDSLLSRGGHCTGRLKAAGAAAQTLERQEGAKLCPAPARLNCIRLLSEGQYSAQRLHRARFQPCDATQNSHCHVSRPRTRPETAPSTQRCREHLRRTTCPPTSQHRSSHPPTIPREGFGASRARPGPTAGAVCPQL